MRVVRQLLSQSVTFGGDGHSGWLPNGAATPRPTEIEEVTLDFRIVELQGGAFSFEWEGPRTEFTGDTWHETLDDTLAQARFWFGIEPTEWEVPN